MTEINRQSLTFALIVFVLVAIGRTSGGDNVPQPSEVASSSVTLSQTREEDFESSIEPVTNLPKTTTRPEPISVIEPKPEPPAITPTADAATSPAVTGTVALVKELGSPYALHTKATERVWPIASITKLATAAVALESLGNDSLVTITDHALASEGTAGNFKPGEVYKVSDLVSAMLVTSSNDAAVALADAFGYSAFMERMRRLALNLNMTQTSFSDPTGLSVLNQSTVFDLERLTQYLLTNHPELFEATSGKTLRIIEQQSGGTRQLISNNRFAGREDFVGGKTGFTNDARENLLSIFELNGRRYLIIVFGSADRFGDTEKLWAWTKQTYN